MKEKIYTIPVTEAFNTECECPMCILEKRLEDESIDYILGPSLMEPEGRTETNENGFCVRHYEKLYNKQINRLGLGLILDTHLVEQNKKIEKIYNDKKKEIEEDCKISLIKEISKKISTKPTTTAKTIDEMISFLSSLEDRCTVCKRLSDIMDRYIDVILYLWFKENTFRALFDSKKGFCLKHFKQLLEGARKHLGSKDQALFLSAIFSMQDSNLNRIQQEVNWFTKKFDYRNSEAPWGNSKDAVSRSIQKICGNCELK